MLSLVMQKIEWVSVMGRHLKRGPQMSPVKYERGKEVKMNKMIN